MPIAAIVNGTTYAVHSDHLNTPRKLSDASGQAAWQWSYSAFGEDKPTTAKNRFANLETTPNPGTTSISEVKFNLRYPGQYADEESGLFYNGFRTYSPTTGRYTQGDPIGLDGGWSRFGYAYQAPLMYTDPTGLFAPLVIPGVCAAGGCEAAGLALAAAAAAIADIIPSGDYSPWSPDPSVNDEFLRDRDHSKDLDSPPQAYKDPNKPECEEIRRRIKHYEDAMKGREKFTSKWYGGLFNPGHAIRMSRLKSEKERLERRLDRGDCVC
jgi:RHS repeat-associated protein